MFPQHFRIRKACCRDPYRALTRKIACRGLSWQTIADATLHASFSVLPSAPGARSRSCRALIGIVGQFCFVTQSQNRTVVGAPRHLISVTRPCSAQRTWDMSAAPTPAGCHACGMPWLPSSPPVHRLLIHQLGSSSSDSACVDHQAGHLVLTSPSHPLPKTHLSDCLGV